MDKRTSILSIIAAILTVVTAGYYGYNLFIKEKPAPPTVTITMRAPAKIAAPVTSPATGAQGIAGAQPGLAEARVIKVNEKGKEVQYKNPDDFVANTSLTPAETAEFGRKKLAESQKALEDARRTGDKAVAARAEADVKMYERIGLLSLSKMKGEQGKEKASFLVLNKRDPFMNPLEVPKISPPIPPNAKPYEKVPLAKIELKAIVWSKKGYRAMVVTEDRRGFTVKVGDGLGDKLGKITKITEKKLYVTEKIRDILGDVETKVTALQLHKEAE